MAFLNLFRGDDILNLKSKPGRYRSEGLTSSAFGARGDPENIEKITFLETVKQHIDHLKTFEKDYFKITDYISFSDSEAIAKNWAAGLKPDELVACSTPFLETRYVFKMQIPNNELKPITTGVWEYRYACNTNLKCANVPNADINTLALRYNPCPICQSTFKNHSLLLINPTIYLAGLASDKKYKRANQLAAKNGEWMIVPNDAVDFKHRTTRIPRADFWNADCYTIKRETARNPFFKYPEN
ncbi:MAG TPA: hypothetical protein DCO83_06090 [Mucilaginibacter sp.]|jgi:hypothetical protein|nr:hypothetical protein [Mucilaginibacter sp.]